MGTRPNYRDEAFVIRSYKLGEADLIFVLLTKEHGVARVVAKGVRKTRSRFGARLERFARISVQIYPGRSLGRITDADTVQNFAPGIIEDIDSYSSASAVLEVAAVLAEEPESTSYLFDLVDQALAIMSGSGGDYGIPAVSVADQFVLRAVDTAGWAPSLVDCAQCGAKGPHRAFHPQAGGAVCVLCRPPGASTPDSQAVRFLWLLQHKRFADAGQVVREYQGVEDIPRVAHSLLLSHVRSHVAERLVAYSAL